MSENKKRTTLQAITEARELCSGIFWVITEDSDISEYKLLMFDIPCDIYGVPSGGHVVPLNSKSGGTYNHKKLWDGSIKNNPAHKLYNKKTFDYYPRGRVEIANDRAIIYLNPNINIPTVISEIKSKFGLSRQNISDVRVSADNSAHYQCWLDWDD
jgi:hypothetical protein